MERPLDRKTARRKFHSQRHGAASRGIAWQLTFQQWLDWWGDDLDRRGRGSGQLQMQRFADTGPYALGNIRKGHPLDNTRTMGRMVRKRNTAAARSESLAAAMAAPTVQREDEPEVEPEDELISDYMGRDGGCPIKLWGMVS